MKKLDKNTSETARADARALEVHADDTESYPADVKISRTNRPSRMNPPRFVDGLKSQA